jgi:hypothetical protein
MGCHISTRTLEHIRDTKLEIQQIDTEHSIICDRTGVIAKIHTCLPCIMREATEITKYCHN